MIIRLLLFVIFIILFPVLYLTHFKDSKIWNSYQDKSYNIKFLKQLLGNDEDGIYFDPLVLESKPYLLDPKYRGTFIDFFIWNILRNPFHNYEILTGIQVAKIIEVGKKEFIFSRGFINFYWAKLNNGFYRFFFESDIYLSESKKLTIYLGSRIKDLVPIEKLNLENVRYKFFNDFIKNNNLKFIQYRGYPVIRNGAAFRFRIY